MNLLEPFKNYLFSQNDKPTKVTVKNYLSDINRFIYWYEATFTKSFTPKEVAKETIEQYKQDSLLNKSALSPRSLERHLSSLRKFFTFLKYEGLIVRSPFEQLLTGNQKSKIDPWRIKDFKDYLYIYNASRLTIKNYLIDLKQFIAWAQEVTTSSSNAADANTTGQAFTDVLAGVNTNLVEEYKQRLLDQDNFSPTTINRKLSSLRKYLSWAEAEGLISSQADNLMMEARNEKLDKDILKSRILEINDSSSKTSHIQPQESQKEYSRIPPLRIAQKVSNAFIFALDSALIIHLAKLVDRIEYALWKTKGQPVFKKVSSIKNQVSSQIPARIAMQSVAGGLNTKYQILNTGKISNIPKSFYAPLEISTRFFPWYKKAWITARYARPKWYKTYHSYPIVHYLHFAVLIIFLSVIAFGFYNTFFAKGNQSPTLAVGLPTAPPRILSFQGRLTNSLDTPISTPSALRFAIYNSLSATDSGDLSVMLWQEVDSVTPDQDGIFNVLLGNNTAIPSTLFTQNNALWLGVTVGQTAELAPRQQLATVAFATNSETLQGLLPITAAGATQSNVVLALDSSGNLTIGGTATPTFQASGGQFTLSGKSLLLTTTSGSNANVTIAPDGLGFIDLRRPLVNTTNNSNVAGANGAVEVDDMLAVLATTSGAAFTLNQNGNGDLITASASGTTKFRLANTGQITAPYYNTAGCTLKADTSGNITCGTGGGVQFWQELSGALSPTQLGDDLLLGGSSTTSAAFAFTGLMGNQTQASMSGNLIVMPNKGYGGNVGIGTTNPGAKLEVLSTTQQLKLSYDSSNYVGLSAGSNGMLNMSAKGINNLIIGNDPNYAGYTNIYAGGIASPDSSNYGWEMKNDGSEIWFNVAPTGLQIISFGTANGTTLVVTQDKVGIGGSYAVPANTLSVTGTANFTGNVGIGDTTPASLLTVGNGDLFQVDSTGKIVAATGITSSGTITFSGFTGANNGGVIYANSSGVLSQTAAGTSTQCLIGGTTTPAWSSCSAAASNYWQRVVGNLSPLNTNDTISATSSADTVATHTTNNPAGTLTNNTLIQQTGAGTVTHLLNLTQSAGAATDAIYISGTFTNLINATNFKVTNAGAVTAVGVNSGTGLLQGTGGLTLTGTTSINNNASTNTTNIGTGSTSGAIAIGGGSDTLAISTTNWGVTSLGVASGLTGLSSSGTVTFSGLGASAFVVTDGSKNLTTAAGAATSAELISILSDETGSGVAVFGTSPALTTSLTTGSTSFDLLNTTATTVNLAGGATTKLGLGSSTANTVNVPSLSASSAVYTDSSKNLTSTAPTTGTIGYWSRAAGNLYPATTNDTIAATSSAATVATFTTNNPAGTLTNNTLIQQTGAGTVTNLLNLTQSAGAVTNGITLTGTFTKLINSTNFNVTNAGAITGVGVNSGTGLLQGTGGLTLTGTTSINDSASTNTTSIGGGTTTGQITIGGTGTQTLAIGNGAGVKTVQLGSNNTTSTTTLLSGSGGLSLNTSNNQPTNINTGTSNGLVTIGGGSGTAAINTTSWGVTSAGVASGLTGLSSSGTITFSGFTGANNGGVIYANSSGVLSQTAAGTSTQCLIGGTTTPAWSSCSSAANNYWQRVVGNLSPLNTNDTIAATSSADTVATFTTNNPAGTLTNNTLIQQTGAGTVTNLLNLTQSAGAATNAIDINGTFTNLINSPTLVVTNAGAASGLTGLVSTGTVTLGGTAGTETLTLGQSTAGQTINIGAATVADTKTQTIHLGDSATGTGKDVITIGNTNGASSLALKAGTGAITLTNATTNVTTFASSTSNSDTIQIKPQSSTATNTFNGILTSADLTTADKTWTFPNASGTVAVSASSPITLSVAGDIGCSTCILGGGTLWTAGATSGTTTQTVAQGGTLTFTAGTGVTTTGSAGAITFAIGQAVGTGNSPTFTGLNLSGLTASQAVFTDGSKNLISNAITGSGNVVMSTSPALTTSLTTASTSFDLLNTTATTVNFAGAATTLNLGAPTGNASISAILTLGGSSSSTIRPGTGALNFGYKSGANTWGTAMTILDNTGNVGIGTITPVAPLSINGGYGANAALIINQLNSGDLFTASASGTTKFTISNTGALTSAAYTAQNGVLFGTQTTGLIAQATTASTGLCLMSGASSPTWSACSAGASNFWQRSIGALSPIAVSDDLLLGSNATATAKFAFTGLMGNQTQASFSGQLIVMPNNGYGGNVGIGTTNPSSKLEIRNTSTASSGDVYNVYNYLIGSPTGAGSANYYGAYNRAETSNTATGNSNSVYGSYNFAGHYSSGTLTSLYGSYNTVIVGMSGGTVQNAYSVYADMGGTNSATNGYGVYIGNVNGTSKKYGLYQAQSGYTNYFASPLGIGTTSLLATLDVRGNSATTPIASFSGSTNFAALVANNDGVGDLFTASASGWTRFRIANNGAITAPFYNTCTLKTDGAGLVICGTDLTGSGINFWQELTGALSPITVSDDLLLGSNATATAKFAFINMNGSGSPTASISGNLSLVVPTGSNPLAKLNILNGGSLNIQTSVGGDGVVTSALYIANNGNVGIGNSNPQAKLDIGGATSTISNTSGDITITPTANLIISSGKVGIGTTSPLATLDVRGNSATIPIASFSGSTNFAGLVVDNSGNGDLITASSSAHGGSNPARTEFKVTNSGNVYGRAWTDLDNSSYFMDLNAAGTSLVTAGNVGIGNTNPGTALDVRGSLGSSTIASISGNLIVMPNGGWGGNVGIGTTSPGQILHLNGTNIGLQVSTNSYGGTSYASYLGSGAGSIGHLQLGNNGTNYIVGGNTAAGGKLDFIVNNSNAFPSTPNGIEAMTILANGNVGIGTTAPLDPGSTGVSKTLQLTGADFSQFIQTVTSGTADNKVWRSIVRSTTYGDVYQIQTLSDAGASEQTGLQITRSGNSITQFAIPATYLAVGAFAGTARSVGDIVARRSASTGVLYFGDNGGNYLYFDGTNYNFNSGNVLTTGSVNAGSYAVLCSTCSAGYYQDVSNGAYRSLNVGGVTGYYFQNYNGVATTMYVGLQGTYAGNVGIGTTTPLSQLSVGGNGTSGTGIFGTGSNNGVEGIVTNSNSGVYAGNGGTGYGIYCSAAAAGGCGGNRVWTQVSDKRLKENITPITDALAKVMHLKGVTYNLIGDSTNVRAMGFLAQDALPYVPEVTFLQPNGYYSMGDADLTALLVNAMQEQQAQIASLSAGLAGVSLTSTGDFNLVDNTATADANFAVPHYFTLNDALGNPISSVGAFAELAVANLRAGGINAQQITTNALSVATDNVTINGQSLRDYITSVVSDAISSSQFTLSNGQTIISPLASVDNLKTNLISPLADNSNISVKLDNSKFQILNTKYATGSAVATIDNQGNATFSGQLSAASGQFGDATISGTLHAGKILASDIVGLASNSATYVTNVTNIYNSTASASSNQQLASSSNFGLITGQATPGTSSATNNYPLTASSYIDISSFSGQLAYVDNLGAANAMFSQNLMVFGQTTLSDTSIVGQLSIGGNMILTNGSINVLGSDLNLQPLRQGGLSVMGGLFTIDTNGNVKVGGDAEFAKNVAVKGALSVGTISPLPGNDLTLNTGNSKLEVRNASNAAVLSVNPLGDLVASGAGTFAKLNLNLIQPAFALSPTELVATGSAGTASVGAYQTQVTINNPSVTDKSLIYITPTSSTNNQVLYLLKQVPGVSFTVGLQNQSFTPIPFNWIIVN